MVNLIKEIKSNLNLNDRELAEYLSMNRGTMYKRMREDNWTDHEILFIKHKHKLCKPNI